MHFFDAPGLQQKLELLAHEQQVRFALACADRLSAFVASPESASTEAALAVRLLARDYLLGKPLVHDSLRALAVRLEGSPALDQDEMAASAYLLECLRQGGAQAAVWVAQRAYETRDSAAQQALDFSAYTPETETAILSHPLVQEELAAQLLDLERLSA